MTKYCSKCCFAVPDNASRCDRCGQPCRGPGKVSTKAPAIHTSTSPAVGEIDAAPAGGKLLKGKQHTDN